ncbi:hypothetical protein TMS3_0124745 [Pseudomonas taeanensis MS-3]|uniref:Uncharacterized protein n=1 Tax=Pseudomonas taeanensis MS-3 TaxID=1395571 RepID=A0A0A1YFJ9_9PSED|nr:hypothetical protein TMS3_0124745 [Pseudomonas taeanensis MS-3]
MFGYHATLSFPRGRSGFFGQHWNKLETSDPISLQRFYFIKAIQITLLTRAKKQENDTLTLGFSHAL